MKGLGFKAFLRTSRLNLAYVKISLIIGLISLASTIVSLGQGAIILDNGMRSAGPYITYGNAGIPANGVSGTSGNVGGFLQGGWTMGLYYAFGDVTGLIASDPTGVADPSTLGGGLVLGTGFGSTAPFSAPGAATADFEFLVPGTTTGGGNTITVIVTAYNTGAGGYASASWRGHSEAFTMTTGGAGAPPAVGNYMPGFSVFTVPEPSTFALAGLNSLILFLFCNRARR